MRNIANAHIRVIEAIIGEIMSNRRSALLKNSEWKPWDHDEVLREVYTNRDAYSAEHGHDVRRIFEDMKRRSEERSRKSQDTENRK